MYSTTQFTNYFSWYSSREKTALLVYYEYVGTVFANDVKAEIEHLSL